MRNLGTSNTTKAPPELIEALEFAQKRWPRLFGQLTGITNVDPRSPGRLGEFEPQWTRTGRLGIEPYPAEKLAKYPYRGLGSFPSTIGHELLHAADNLTIPEFYDRYVFSAGLPGKYLHNSYEIRANRQGFKTDAYTKGATRKDFLEKGEPQEQREPLGKSGWTRATKDKKECQAQTS